VAAALPDTPCTPATRTTFFDLRAPHSSDTRAMADLEQAPRHAAPHMTKSDKSDVHM
jgi:hypothetical protein